MNAQQIYYREVYLKSDHWLAFRKYIIQSRWGRCEKCASRKRLEVHHKNYNNLWHERDGDVLLLCHECHSKLHKKPRRRKRK